MRALPYSIIRGEASMPQTSRPRSSSASSIMAGPQPMSSARPLAPSSISRAIFF